MSAVPVRRDVVVVGASAGGVEALRALVADLPRDLPAAVLVVLHLAEGSPSALAGILGRAGSLPVATATDGEALRPGTVRVASAGHHLLLHDGVLSVTRGPREYGYRPAVDVLFRSAAAAAGPRVVAVVLSGALDDGTAGVAAVRSAGGIAVAQDPADALYPGMPLSVIGGPGADHVVPMARIPGLLCRLVRGDEAPRRRDADDGSDAGGAAGRAGKDEPGNPGHHAAATRADPATGSDPAQPTDAPPDATGRFACPDCHGTLEAVEDASVVRFRCRIGHGWSAATLLAQQSAEHEQALEVALRSLRERESLARHLGERATQRGHHGVASRFVAQSERARHAADLLERSLDQVHRLAGFEVVEDATSPVGVDVASPGTG